MTGSANPEMPFPERFDLAYRVLSSPSFLAMEGLGLEVPYFILPYQAACESQIPSARRRLITRLRNTGISVCDVDLWALATTLWRATGVWEQMLAAEESMPKDTFGEAVGNVVSPAAHLSPAIERTVSAQVPEPSVVLLSNVGRLFPLVRAHTILNTLQPLLTNVPVVLIFPGSYKQSPTQGSSLELFHQMADDDYYRAFDLLDLEGS